MMHDVECRILGPDDQSVLMNVAPDVFDMEVVPRLVAEFLNDPRHHVIVAIASGQVVGFVTSVHYVHPDKPTEMWINEVSVAPEYRQRGLARRLLDMTLELARELACANAWVLTDDRNLPAIRLYGGAGGVAAPTVLFEFALGVE